MKKCLLIDHDDWMNIQYFKEVFANWNIPLAICSNPDNALMKLNIEKPDLVLLSADLQIEYQNIVNYIFSKNIEVIFYGQKIEHLLYLKKPLVKAIFPEPYKLNLFKLKNIFFPEEILEKEILSEKPSHVEMVINEKVGVIEIEGSLPWENIHEIKYQLMHLFNTMEIKGIILIFHEIPQSDAYIFKNIEHLLNLANQIGINPSLIQVISFEERIKIMIQEHPSLNKIGLANSYIEAFLKIQSKQVKQKETGVWVFRLNNKTALQEDMYDEFGELIKKKGTFFTEAEIQKLSDQNILKLYTSKELLYMDRALNPNLNSENILSNQANSGKGEINTKKSVLIIDDDTMILKLLKKIIEKLGYEVITASNGIEGFDYATDLNPGLIMVDLMMPGLNGIDLIKNYKELRGAKAAPIIVVSTISMREVIKPLLEMGVDYIIKPIKVSVLISKITKAIQ